MKELFVNIRGKLLDNKEKVAILICSLFIIIIIVFKVGRVISPNNLKGEMSQSAIDKGFKDENFYRCVIDNYNDDNGTNLTISDDLPSNLNKLKSLSCTNRQIEDTSGIDNMPNLTQIDLARNKLTSIDLSGNTKLIQVGLSHNLFKEFDFSKVRPSTVGHSEEPFSIVIKPNEVYDVANNIKGIDNINIESNDDYTYEDGILTNKDSAKLLVYDGSIHIEDFNFISHLDDDGDGENFTLNGDNINVFYCDDDYIINALKSYRGMFDYKVNDDKLEIYDDKTGKFIRSYNIRGVRIKNAKMVFGYAIATIDASNDINDYIESVSDEFKINNNLVYRKDNESGEPVYRLKNLFKLEISNYKMQDNVIYTGGEKFDKSKVKITVSFYLNDKQEPEVNDVTDDFTIDISNNKLKVDYYHLNFFELDYFEKIEHNIKIDIDGSGTANSNVQSALEGADINLTINPSDNYELDSVSILDKNNNDITGKVNYNNKTHSFVMPDYDIIINVKFKKIVTTVKSNSKAEEKTSNNKTTTTTKIKTTTESTTTGKITTTTTKTIKNTTLASSKNNDVTIKKNSCSYYDIAIIMLIVVDIILVGIIIYKALKENNKDIR